MFPQSTAPEVNSVDNLLAGGEYTSHQVTIVADAAHNLTRGTLLGVEDADGTRARLSLAAAGDGTQVPRMVLVEDIDATAGDVVAPVYIAGYFNDREVVYGAGHTAASVFWSLAEKGIYLVNPVAANATA